MLNLNIWLALVSMPVLGHHYQDSVTVAMKGIIELVKIQSLFTTFDFSNNNFKGEIPKELESFDHSRG